MKFPQVAMIADHKRVRPWVTGMEFFLPAGAIVEVISAGITGCRVIAEEGIPCWYVPICNLEFLGPL